MKEKKKQPVEESKCSMCWGYGFWALGYPSPMGQFDSKSMPSYKCPQCGKGMYDMPEELQLMLKKQMEEKNNENKSREI